MLYTIIIGTEQPDQPTLDQIMDEARSCAWCLREQGIEPETGSHGICPTHADLQYQRTVDERRARRKGCGNG